MNTYELAIHALPPALHGFRILIWRMFIAEIIGRGLRRPDRSAAGG